MVVKEAAIVAAIESMAEHYRTHVVNRFTRSALESMAIDPGVQTRVTAFLERCEDIRANGRRLDELYQDIQATIRFVNAARRQALPRLRAETRFVNQRLPSHERLLRDMTLSNLEGNLALLGRSLADLYAAVMAIDEAAAVDGPPIHWRFVELRDLAQNLVA